MNLRKAKAIISNHFVNFPGVRTNRRLVVIESDDWGSIRMPSKKIYEFLLKKGISVDKCPYNRFDCLESGDDLERLFDLLTSFVDFRGNYPIFTANTIVANPDFEKIEQCGFEEYHYENVSDTFKRYLNHQRSFSLWKEGRAAGVFQPQLHGREHLNIRRWMTGLRTRLPETMLTFGARLFGLSTTITNEKRGSYLAVLDFDQSGAAGEGAEIIAEGAQLFENIFGYRSKTFIAPNYIWSASIERLLQDMDVNYFQGISHQQLPAGENRKTVRHFFGEQNAYGQRYLVRNCFFEPSIFRRKDSVETCLKQISTAFFWSKPAIISSHRLNFIGEIDPRNSAENLKALKMLLKSILQRWPDVEFVSSDKLAEMCFETEYPTEECKRF